MIELEIKNLSEKIGAIKNKVTTEEATKNAFVMPFLQALGYDVFDPEVIIPEFTADIGTKKGEKVDYAIMRDGEPLVIIEVKKHTEVLDDHNNQLVRYFNACLTSKFAILTNGIEYRFFSDIDAQNRMDKTPFLIFNLEKPTQRGIKELERFMHSELNIDDILKMASANRYHQHIQKIFKEQIEKPTDDFVRIFASQLTEKRMTESVLEEFRGHIHRAFNNMINELAGEKIIAIKNNISDNQEKNQAKDQTEETDIIVTTEEELQAFYIVRSFFADREDIKISDIGYKDTLSYFGVLYQDKVTKWLCRFFLNGSKKFFTLPGENGKDHRINIESIDEIYNYKKEINEALDKRL
ncbi:hypothetical protein BKH46_05065 [Helicobacter sp. 12S02634-8]|uniref:type I restriction endonuclease n=1 Tax=Helicobacter sp. 12S02634-8 TaxID=1476199 RepID=UPI000BA7988D|nr:type I restriction endonuclease [Helicobacter sp. 12S02634-8]PAF47090.1 hypothetical protein BKH46_05065 [Helicobacter sp. 12S02634-8]